MAWEENSRICLHMQLIAILSRIGVSFISAFPIKTADFIVASCALWFKFLIFAPCLVALGKLRVKLSLHRK